MVSCRMTERSLVFVVNLEPFVAPAVADEALDQDNQSNHCDDHIGPVRKEHGTPWSQKPKS